MANRLAASLREGDFAWLVGSVCQINRLPFDPALLLQRFPAPHSVRQLLEALRALGFKAGEGELARAAYPCIGFLQADERAASDTAATHSAACDSAASETADTTSLRPALLVKRDAERLLFFEAGSQAPKTVPLGEVRTRFAAEVLLVRLEATDSASSSSSEPGGAGRDVLGAQIAGVQAAGAQGAAQDGALPARKFGFAWFWAELAKHKGVWRDVLALARRW